jgi:hypothetical protein
VNLRQRDPCQVAYPLDACQVSDLIVFVDVHHYENFVVSIHADAIAYFWYIQSRPRQQKVNTGPGWRGAVPPRFRNGYSGGILFLCWSLGVADDAQQCEWNAGFHLANRALAQQVSELPPRIHAQHYEDFASSINLNFLARAGSSHWLLR